jgi:alpha-L-arabinofuranosidase
MKTKSCIGLLLVLGATAPAERAGADAAKCQATVVVIRKADAKPYSKMIFGGFLEHFDNQVYGGVYDPGSPLSDKDGFRRDVIRALKELKISVIRWPGGCFVDSYHWRNGVGKERQPHGDFRWGVMEPNTFGTHEFVELCRRLGAEPYVCFNGLASAQENLDWVAYCNATEGEFADMRRANGHAEPLDVRFWSVGNERYDAESINRVRDTAREMKERYPEVLIMAPGSQCGAPVQKHLMEQAGEYLDYVSIHDYWLDRANDLPEYSYEQAMSKCEMPEKYIQTVQDSLVQHKMDRLRIAFDEWNLRAWQHPGFPRDGVHDYDDPEVRRLVELRRKQNDAPAQYTMADALFAASFFNACLRHSDAVAMANVAPLVNTRGPLFVHEKGIVRRTHYHAMWMYANLLEDQVAGATVTASRLALGGESVAVVDAVATVDPSGRTWAIALVNRHPSETVDCLVQVGEKPLDGRFRATLLAGDSPDAYNDIEHPGRVRPEKVRLSFEKGVVRLPPHSLVIVHVTTGKE